MNRSTAFLRFDESVLVFQRLSPYNKQYRFVHGVIIMTVSYKKLWKLLIDKDMMKKDLKEKANISWTSITKMSKGEDVSMEVLKKVCYALECDIGDIIEMISDK